MGIRRVRVLKDVRHPCTEMCQGFMDVDVGRPCLVCATRFSLFLHSETRLLLSDMHDQSVG